MRVLVVGGTNFSGSDIVAVHVCVSSEQLEEFKIRPWIDLPAWIPVDGAKSGFSTFSSK